MSTRVMFANEPRAYREVLAAAVGVLRPDITAVAVDPADLDRELDQMQPRLIVCSSLTDDVKSRAPAWLLLSPAAAPRAVLCLHGVQTTLVNPEFSDILAVVDQVRQGPEGGGERASGQTSLGASWD